MQAIRFAANYLLYYLKALDEHSLHSPLVFDLYNHVIKNSTFDTRYRPIENKRSALHKNENLLNVTDLGAGSSLKKEKQRKISSIARKSMAPAKKSQLLHRLIKYYQPDTIIDLGTCLGLNTLYLALEQRRVVTFEGCPTSATEARKNWQEFEFSKDIELIEGNINQTLPAFLAQEDKTDFVFMDANHTYEATIDYFDLLASKAHQDTVIAIDDIHWSKGMEKAWHEIKAREDVFLSLDLFHLGIVLFKPLYLKQHYVLEF